MSATIFYKVIVRIGDKEHTTVFYRDTSGQFDLLSGWAKYTTRMHETLDSAIAEFREKLQAEEYKSDTGLIIAVGKPREISPEEMKALRGTS